MKHYFSFLVLSLSVFLSLVCPSPVMAELVSSLKVEAEDGLNIEVINGSNCSPSNMSLNTESKFGGSSGTGGMISPQSGGEVYLPLVINYNGASYGSMTVDFQIRCGNNDNGRTYINFYQECAGNDSPDLRISSSGSYYNKYYKKVGYQQVYGGSWYEAYQTHTVNRSFTEGSYLIGLFARDYAIYDYVQINTSAAIIQDGDAEPSCTKPNHVDISGNWDYFVGETIELTAQAYSSEGTGSPMAEGDITGYQWKHNGVDIDGATSKTYSLTTTSPSDGGDYSCVVSTGATCSTESSSFRTKVYALQCYTDGTTTYNFTRVGTSKVGTVEVPLTSGHKEFKIYAGASQYYGNNTSAVYSDISNYEFKGNEDNFKLEAGLGGTFTFTIDYTENGGAPKVSVTYPRKTIYLTPGVWNKDGAKFAIYYFISDNVKGWTDIMTANDCAMSAEIPLWNGVKINAVRLKESATNNNKSEWWTSHTHNKTNDCPISANDYITITGWNTSDYTYTTYAPLTYTITFADNGSNGGSAMSNVTAIPCGESRTLVANTWERTGHSFTGWIANVDVKINGETVTAGTLIADRATIQDITQNITLTAQWAPKTTSITLDANTAHHGDTGNSVTATWGTALPNFVATTGESGYVLTGYFTAPTGGTKIINADGTLVASTSYTTADSKWNSEESTLTLYPQYKSSIDPKTVPCSLNFIYTQYTNDQTKKITDSDFSYSCNADVAKKSNEKVCFSGVGHTLTSRMDVIFPQSGTYKFTFPLYITEGGNYNAPRVTVNGQQSADAIISTAGAENRNYETTLNVTAGTYTVSVWIGNTNEKVFFSTMDITSYQSGNIITTGAEGLFSENVGSGGDASYTCSSVADPECHFDHEVFCFEYSNMGGNSSNYYGCRLTNGPAYTPNAAATGFAFWYRTESESDPVYMEFAGKAYKLAATNRAWHYAYVEADDAKTKDRDFDIWINGQKDGFSTTQSSGKIYLSELQATNVTSADPIPSTHHIITVASNNNTYGTVSSTPASGSSVADCASITVTATPESGYSFVAWKKGDTQVSTEALYTFTMSDHNDGSDLTLTAYFQQNVLTISSLPWDGSQNLTEGTVVSAEAFNSCFDTKITFTFTGEGTVNYYYNDDRETSLGTVQSGQPIELTEALRAHGIYIRCTTGEATLTGVSKTTNGSVYQIWSGEVAVGAWLQQVVLGPEHFQTAIVGDVLRVYTSDEGSAEKALQYIVTNGDEHIYKGLDASPNEDGRGTLYEPLSDEDKTRNYFEITINATQLANLQHYGVIVKGLNYTIQSVELRASCSNDAMRTTAPDKQIYGEDGSIDIMARKLELGGKGKGFCLGNWEHKLELDENCFKNVTVGSLINFYMQVQEGATLSFRCNVDSIEAETYDPEIPRCPSYGDISFDRTIDNLYGDAPKLIGQNKGYEVLSLLVDDDMLTRLQQTGMILCGKGACIKIVEGVPNPFVIDAGENKEIPTVVNNLEIHQGGQASNEDDIEVLGSITYFRPAKGGYWGNQLDTWYTFTLPFEVNDVEVKDIGDENWYDINAVYYSSDDKDQDTYAPDGAGHYYLQYLSKQEIATDRELFITRWKYITPGHSLACVSQYEENNGTRHGYPKKNEAYIILFDSEQPIGSYFKTNTEVRFVGGPQTIEGTRKLWTVEASGYEYWMYANNTLHSFTYPGDVYILNEEGTYFILQSNPTIRPFECYVQATESLKAKHAALPMRGFNIEDNTPTGMESMQGSAIRAEKILRNGQLIIIRNGVEYDATGAVIR